MEGTILLIAARADAFAPASALRAAGFHVVACEPRAGWRHFCEVAPALVLLALDEDAPAELVREATPGARRPAFDLLARLRRASRVPVVLFARAGGVPDAVHAMQRGATDFVLARGGELEARLTQLARRMLASGRAPTKARVRLGRRLPGASPAIARVRERIAALARLRAPVLFSGEPGSGRSHAARALHDLRAPGAPLLECSAPELGALPAPPRVGSVYLKNIEALAPALQRALREQLEHAEREAPLGLRALPAPAAAPSWFAASEPALLARAPALGFDARLLQLLTSFEVRVPTLRERPEDVPRIARVLLARANTRLGRTLRFSDAALRRLRAEAWPGNVRELESAVAKLAAFATARVIEDDAVRDVLADLRPSVSVLRERSAREERESLLRALAAEGGNVTRAARRLGIGRTTVYRMVERHGIALRERG